ncbi:MAG: hypothetical protein A3H52_00035 [Candidatus Zambryskibacteria bacterium RIFCSPLOWO2_02_FULL_39_26]|uniref:Uncharacterized protein n=1 Tax=Candidatus Zambryskibacteria bacterium RIFCSPLOWO2_12_FULL_39_23 TaxID=1802776 RepID=A0A1G2USD9_9BACT|nr:MAG: hypothetical protein A2W51_01880 [Candidatus Zambryskibacteria bacterium RIFCSPHIGHO2_02_39_10]OHA99728.1 MAG: hypothetical protein A3E59_00775 [Candidatus Zambryskibacteria bacterium RIFCSPHIGHO2_12_FULL_39_47]OHB10158.1 MAG: hypothetical protein A3H52_00035 [Candidatus Zambryskibacteria bacterium RIFCSPLOWO2_02_FULL_39_26]OHB12299.1 MAG: hypothetical protein A3G99_00295 [Candidatus Zambryskibacteria bacterium RIFCSPLOWO2_12_FULL_39_23]
MEKSKQIKGTTKWLMFSVAVFFDIISLLSLVPVVGWIFEFLVWLFAFMTFWLWFLLNGINIMSFRNPKKLAGTAIGSIIEASPLGFVPAWTILILYLTRIEPAIEKVVSQVPGGETALGKVVGKTGEK